MDRRPILADRIIEQIRSNLVASGGQIDEAAWREIIISSLRSDLVVAENSKGPINSSDLRLIDRFMEKYPDLRPVVERALLALRTVFPTYPIDISLHTDPETEGICFEKQHLTLEVLFPPSTGWDTNEYVDRVLEEWRTKVETWVYDDNAPQHDLLLITMGFQSEESASGPLARLHTALSWTDLSEAVIVRSLCERGMKKNEATELVEQWSLLSCERPPTDEQWQMLADLMDISVRWLRNTSPPERTFWEAIEGGILENR